MKILALILLVSLSVQAHESPMVTRNDKAETAIEILKLMSKRDGPVIKLDGRIAPDKKEVCSLTLIKTDQALQVSLKRASSNVALTLRPREEVSRVDMHAYITIEGVNKLGENHQFIFWLENNKIERVIVSSTKAGAAKQEASLIDCEF